MDEKKLALVVGIYSINSLLQSAVFSFHDNYRGLFCNLTKEICGKKYYIDTWFPLKQQQHKKLGATNSMKLRSCVVVSFIFLYCSSLRRTS
jgi:hypothetical protein